MAGRFERLVPDSADKADTSELSARFTAGRVEGGDCVAEWKELGEAACAAESSVWGFRCGAAEELVLVGV